MKKSVIVIAVGIIEFGLHLSVIDMGPKRLYRWKYKKKKEKNSRNSGNHYY